MRVVVGIIEIGVATNNSPEEVDEAVQIGQRPSLAGGYGLEHHGEVVTTFDVPWPESDQVRAIADWMLRVTPPRSIGRGEERLCAEPSRAATANALARPDGLGYHSPRAPSANYVPTAYTPPVTPA